MAALQSLVHQVPRLWFELLAVAAWHGAKAAERTGAGAGPQRVTGGKALAPVIKAVRKHCRCVKRKQKA
jgi:hypothetical protein